MIIMIVDCKKSNLYNPMFRKNKNWMNKSYLIQFFFVYNDCNTMTSTKNYCLRFKFPGIIYAVDVYFFANTNIFKL